jgi:hypothetical protein
MLSWLRRDPTVSLQRTISKKYEQAVSLQRNGRLREYGELMKEISELETKLEALQQAS